MVTLALAVLGTLIALAGLVMLAPSVRALQLSGSSLGAWMFRAGVMVCLAAELLALFTRPDPIVFKTMLVSGAAILFVGLAMLPQEWRQPGYVVGRSFSWQVIILGFSAFLTAMMFIEVVIMFIVFAVGWFSLRYFQGRVAGNAEPGAVQNIAFGAQVGVIIVTFAMLLM